MKQRDLVIVNWKDRRHPEAGGAEKYCESIALELVRLGERVTLVTSRPKGLPREERRDGYLIRRMGGRLTVYPLVLWWLFRNRERIAGVIDSQNGIPFFAPLAVGRRMPVALLIHHVHQQQFGLYFPPVAAAIGRWLEGPGSRLVYGRRAVCAVSPSSRTEIRRQLGLAGPIFLAPNGSSAPTGRLAARAAQPTITVVGRLVPHKRYELLVEAAVELVRHVPDLRINVVGTGPEAERLKDLVDQHQLGEVVLFHGFVDLEVRDRLLSEAWLTVSTSVGEGWGLSMIEAAAVGVPAVAIDVPGLRDSVQHESTGWLTSEARLITALLSAIDELRDEWRAGELSAACQTWAGSLRWSATAERFRAVLNAEAARLARSDDRRRSRADAATLVTLDRASALRFPLHALRGTDQATFCARCSDRVPTPTRLLLYGTDEVGAARALARCGVDPASHHVTITPCPTDELLRWPGEGLAHHCGGAAFSCPHEEAPARSRPEGLAV